jgi:effector protein LidA
MPEQPKSSKPLTTPPKPTPRAEVKPRKAQLDSKTSHLEDPNERLFVQLLGQTGLKNAKQAAAFWKTVSGKSVKALIHEQAALFTALKQIQHQNNLDNYIRKLRIMAFLYLIAVYRKKAHAKELNAAIQKQIDKMVSNNQRSAIKEVESYLPDANKLVFSQTYAAYQLASQLIDSALAGKLKEAQELEEELAVLEIEHKAILQRYAIFEDSLDLLDKDYALFEQRTQGKSTAEKIKDFKEMIAALNLAIDKKREEIDELVSSNQNEELAKKFDELNALNGRSVGMDDILAVLENKKSFYDASGLKVPSYKMAVFILPHTLRLYIDPQSGLVYLLSATPNLSAVDLKHRFDSLSPEDKLSAQHDYEQSKPSITNIRQVVSSNKEQELALNHTRTQQALAHSDRLQQEILDLSNQAAAIAAFMDQIANELSPNAQLPLPKTTPTPSPSGSSVKKDHVSKAQIYRHILELIKSNPTKDAIDRFADSFKLKDGKPNKEAQDLIRNTIIPGMPIPKVAMDFLLQNLPRLAVTANSPRVTPIPDKTPDKVITPPPPNPFKTTPF